MKEKCNKYETLFIFGTEDDIKEHIAICSDCREEYLKDQQVSLLVKELKPVLMKKKSQSKIFINLAAMFFIVFIAFFAVENHFSVTQNFESAYVKQDSVIAQMGLPTDEYGLLRID